MLFNVFLRFFELFWIAPVLYGKPAYASMDYLHVELFSSVRKFPKTNKDGEKPKEFTKDKKVYHILIEMLYHAAVCDVVGAWYSTYTGRDVLDMQQSNPAMFFLFFVVAIFVLNSAFNAIGCGQRLLYVLWYEGGSYSSGKHMILLFFWTRQEFLNTCCFVEQWRPWMKNPIIASSLDELWSDRWHQLLRSSWVAFAFRPTRFVAQRALAKHIKDPMPIVLLLSVASVFAISGLMHEYIIYANVGWSVYRRFFVGQQFCFFYAHGLATVFERVFRKVAKRVLPPALYNSIFARLVQHAWVVLFAYYTFPTFLDGFAYWGLWLDNPFQNTKPYVWQFLRTIPEARAFCGSLL